MGITIETCEHAGKLCDMGYIGFECVYHKPIYCKKTNAAGKYMVKQQCMNCGESGAMLKFSLVDDVEKLPLFSDTLHDRICKLGIEERAAYLERRKARQRDNFFSQHNEYLKSNEWREKRRLVLLRDKGLCQACLINPATQVHHLSYANWKNEPLFDLVSVCKPCHDSIHKE